MCIGHFVGFRMVIRRFVRVRESLVSAAGVAHEDGEPSFRTVIVWKHGFRNWFWVSGTWFCSPSLQALRAETIVDGLPRAFRSWKTPWEKIKRGQGRPP